MLYSLKQSKNVHITVFPTSMIKTFSPLPYPVDPQTLLILSFESWLYFSPSHLYNDQQGHLTSSPLILKLTYSSLATSLLTVPPTYQALSDLKAHAKPVSSALHALPWISEWLAFSLHSGMCSNATFSGKPSLVTLYKIVPHLTFPYPHSPSWFIFLAITTI